MIRSQLAHSLLTTDNSELRTAELRTDNLSYAPNAVKKIITNPSPNSPSATNSRHVTLYHGFPTTDQQSWIANQNAATAIAPNSTT